MIQITDEMRRWIDKQPVPSVAEAELRRFIRNVSRVAMMGHDKQKAWLKELVEAFSADESDDMSVADLRGMNEAINEKMG